jgi:hypothetical protein
MKPPYAAIVSLVAFLAGCTGSVGTAADRALGEACGSNVECASQVCLAVEGEQVCSRTCVEPTDCDGLECRALDAGRWCVPGANGCTPACEGKGCGPDGCGGSCAPGCADAASCVDGTCVTTPPPICDPDAVRCATPTAPERCTVSGDAWEPLAPCAAGTSCDEGECLQTPGGEPAGFVMITDEPWDHLPTDPANGRWTYASDHNIAIEQDPLAIRSPSSILRIRYPLGIGGSSPLSMWTGAPADKRFNQLYFSVWYKWAADFAPNTTDNKQFWPKLASDFNSPYTTFDGAQMRVAFKQQGENYHGTLHWRNTHPNMGPASHQSMLQHRGKWVRLEYFIAINLVDHVDRIDRADGMLRAWVTVDGERHQVMDYTDMKFFDRIMEGPDAGKYVGRNGELFDGKYHGMWVALVYGGGDNPPYATDMYWDHFYMSGGNRADPLGGVP